MTPEIPAARPAQNNLVMSMPRNDVMESKIMAARTAIAAMAGMKKMLLRKPSTSSGSCRSDCFLLFMRANGIPNNE
jgi:hypothetical protein